MSFEHAVEDRRGRDGEKLKVAGGEESVQPTG